LLFQRLECKLMEELRHQTNISFNEISLLIETGRDIDTVVTRLKAIQEAHLLLDPSSCESAWFLKVSQAIQNLTEDDTRRVGRPSIQVDLNAVEVLLSMNFRATKIAKLLNVSLRTLRRRMSDAEISVFKFVSLLLFIEKYFIVLFVH